VVISVLSPPAPMNHKPAFAAALMLLTVLGLRTAIRGTDWRDPFTLASRNIEVSREDYNSEIEIAVYLAQQGALSEAGKHADRAVAIYPTTITYNTLGIVLINSGEYAAAKTAFLNGLKYGDLYQLYENLGAVTTMYGFPDENKAFLVSALEKFPESGQIWLYLAILDQRNSDNAGAKTAITNASKYGASNQYVYNQIMNNEPINIASRPVLK
jgi:Tfp pilus assembly protein PilF